MACPTCTHTLAVLCLHEGVQYSHCERCGTVVCRLLRGGCEDRVYVPSLVSRCRKFEALLPTDDPRIGPSVWHQIGIAEAINTPAKRRQT